MQQKLRERRTTNGSFRQEKCEAVEDEDHEQNRSPNFEPLQLDILSLGFVCSFPHVLVISLTLETHVLCETRIGCEELPKMMFQQIVFSFREEARVTRCHEQLSTTTFLLSSTFTQLDRRPAGTQLTIHLQSLELCTSAPLLSQVPASLPTDEPLFTRFQTSSEPQRCRFIVSKSQHISIPDWHTIDMSQAILRLR